MATKLWAAVNETTVACNLVFTSSKTWKTRSLSHVREMWMIVIDWGKGYCKEEPVTLGISGSKAKVVTGCNWTFRKVLSSKTLIKASPLDASISEFKKEKELW